MKAIKTIILFLVCYIFGQSVTAQSCPAGKILACRFCGSNGLPECKCVDEKNAAKWQKNVHPCRMQIASIRDTIGQNLFDECSHLILNANRSTLLWSSEDNSDKIMKNTCVNLYRIGGCRCNEVGYGCAGWPPDYKCRSRCAKFCNKFLTVLSSYNKNPQDIIVTN
jgi:hypothetical protein